MTGIAPIKRRWSISAARAYWACPHQWWLTRVAHVPRTTTEYSFRGQLMHAGLAAGWVALHRNLGNATAMFSGEGALIDAMHTEAEHLEVPCPDEAIDTAWRALKHLGPRIGDELLGAERDLDLRIDGVPIGYRADLIYRRKGMLTLRDWKSTSKLPKAADLPQDDQLALGALAVARTYAAPAVRIEFASINAAAVRGGPISADRARQAGQAVAETAIEAEADIEHKPTPGSACHTCPVVASCFVHNPGVTVR